ncbi:T-cell surface glycoprotein CD3 epsilon chain [Protopterus annectens]|uniref:T-cell surface glycoprotein CD3 epsilon chain n=1 Tax=Protopterus annectens TaxID=7888 RepID=UPI001CFBF084|nr:T-cell surface glycoprotein CD3 epsilon chain [Protopterus annectens]XP_043936824.1 T-cell surface glycoprotein CD3 epsilon chain [Protopterus annectens]
MKGITTVLFTGTMLLFLGAAEAISPISPVISGTKLQLTCADASNPTGIWDHKGAEKELLNIPNLSETRANIYKCTVGTSKYNFYVKAKVCPNCVDMNAMTVAGIIVADLLITLGVGMTVYYCTKNRQAKGNAWSKAYNGGMDQHRPPPVPNPDYAALSKPKREVYSSLNPQKKFAPA